MANSTAVVPSEGGGAVTPAQPAQPAQPATNLPAQLTDNGGQPFSGNSGSREIQKPAGTAVAYSLAAYSNLDELCTQMTLLNGELGMLLDQMLTLKKLSESLEQVITNVDELAEHYEATAMTRSAADADSTICVLIDDLVDNAQQRGFEALRLNALAYEGLNAMRVSQDRMRAQGAGPRLMATAGRG